MQMQNDVSPEISFGHDDPMPPPDPATLSRQISLGDQAQAFIQSELGERIRTKSAQDHLDAAEAFAHVDPEDTAAIRKLQFRSAVAQQAVRYIVEIINEAETAERRLAEINVGEAYDH